MVKIVDLDVFVMFEINVIIVLNELCVFNDSNNVVWDCLYVMLVEDVICFNVVNIDKYFVEICIFSGEMFFVVLDERWYNY